MVKHESIRERQREQLVKSLKLQTCLIFLRKSKEASITGAEWVARRKEVRELTGPVI